MAWSVKLTISEWTSPPVFADSGDRAYRLVHVESQRLLPLPFARHSDARAAMEIMNRECACDGTTAEQARDEMARVFGSLEKLRNRLVAECCAW